MPRYVGCPSCGKTITDDEVVCPHCGKQTSDLALGAPVVATTTSRAQPTTSAGLYFLVAVCVVLLVGAFVWTSRESTSGGTRSTAAERGDNIISTNGTNPMHDKLRAMAISARNDAFTKVNADGCQVIDNDFRGVDRSNVSWWLLACSGGKRYLLSVQPNATGSTRGLDCSVAKVVKVDCDAWMGAPR